MAQQKPSQPKGTRDFGPEVMAKRQYMLSVIRNVFEKFGFQPLETPALENLSVLTGKYGDEGDQLMFKVLNSGNFAGVLQPDDLATDSKAIARKIAEKALRYDLTVPFARYVVMNRHALAMPFKRYQIQPVWRADRPQRGRYREFYQCDADVVGTDSLLCEAEIILMINEVMQQLNLHDFSIKLNNRKVLTSISEAIGCAGNEALICTAIDKLDKIGWDGVQTELLQKGISNASTQMLLPYLELKGTNKEQLNQLETLFTEHKVSAQGITEIRKVLQYVHDLGLQNSHVEVDFSLARGLSYYTGAIVEVKANGVQMGSISGGGRYDNLTGAFGMPGLSGVGFSFGVDRMYDVLEELQLFPASAVVSTQVLFANFEPEAEKLVLSLLTECRQNGIRAEIYPDNSKLKKQLDYADKKQIPFVVLAGPDEVSQQEVQVKNMQDGTQQRVKTPALSMYLKSIL